MEALLKSFDADGCIYELDEANDSGMIMFQTLCKIVGKEGDGGGGCGGGGGNSNLALIQE